MRRIRHRFPRLNEKAEAARQRLPGIKKDVSENLNRRTEEVRQRLPGIIESASETLNARGREALQLTQTGVKALRHRAADRLDGMDHPGRPGEITAAARVRDMLRPGTEAGEEQEAAAKVDPEITWEENPVGADEAGLNGLDPDGPQMAGPHQHRAYWSVPRPQGGRTENCRCGAQRGIGLLSMGNWTGGEPVGTPWERAHLEAVRMAVEEVPELLTLQPRVIQNLNETIRNDPPPEAEGQDMGAVTAVCEIARGAARRMLEWERRNGDPPPG